MKTLLILIVLLYASIALASGCFLTGSTVDGLNRICYYQCVEGNMAITISATEICPLSL